MVISLRRSRRDTVVDEPVRSLLSAASAPTEPGPVPGEVEALAAFRVAQADRRSTPVKDKRRSTRVAVAAAAGVATFGLAGAAVAGTLPGAAQDTASEWLGKVGVTVPGADDASSANADERGASADAPPEDSGRPDHAGKPEDAGSQGKGEEISELARNTEATGRDKGAEISSAASEGKSRAGGSDDEATGGVEGNGRPEDAGSQGKGGEISELARNTDATGRDKGAEISSAASEGKSRAGQQGGRPEDKPAQPEKPTKPETPAQPEKPAKPEKPAPENKPDTPAQPEKPGKPGQAGQQAEGDAPDAG